MVLACIMVLWCYGVNLCHDDTLCHGVSVCHGVSLHNVVRLCAMAWVLKAQRTKTSRLEGYIPGCGILSFVDAGLGVWGYGGRVFGGRAGQTKNWGPAGP